MKSKKTIGILLIILFFSSCRKNLDILHPEILKPNWNDIDKKNIKLNIGDVLSIKSQNNVLYGIVLDYNEDSMGIWYGISLSKEKIDTSRIYNSQFFGRKIPNGLVNTNYIESFDLVFLNENGINENINIIGNYNLNRNNISIGAKSSAKNISEIESNFKFSKKQRIKKPSEKNKNILSSNQIDENYINLNNVIQN